AKRRSKAPCKFDTRFEAGPVGAGRTGGGWSARCPDHLWRRLLLGMRLLPPSTAHTAEGTNNATELVSQWLLSTYCSVLSHSLPRIRAVRRQQWWQRSR